MMEGGQKETAVSPGGAGIGHGYLQICGAPARNSVDLAMFGARRGKGVGGGGRGGFIGRVA
jgi:hypothetical protein